MTPKFCPHCGAPIRPGQIYCIECGTHLDTWSSDDDEKSVPGEVTSIMNRINLAVDEGIASPDPIPEVDESELASLEEEAETPVDEATEIKETSSETSTPSAAAPESAAA
jgi:hypothetical protein